MQKKFHGLFLGISVLPALLVMPAVGDTITVIDSAIDLPAGGTYDVGAITVADVDRGSVSTPYGLIDNNGTLNFTGTTLSNNNGKYGVVDNMGILNADGVNVFRNTAMYGAFVYNENVAIIKNSTFAENEVSVYGGAILTLGSTSRLNIDNSKFTRNKADVGGAIAELLHSGQTTITNSSFVNNEANEIGALYLLSATALIQDSSFIGNESKNTETAITYDGGGAIWIGSESTTNINRVVFENNKAGTDGGAIASRRFNRGNNVASTLDIASAEFKNNTAGRSGGAIDNYVYNDANNDGYVKITSSNFLSNSALNGGAIYNHIGATTDVKNAGNQQVANIRLQDVTFTGNTASEQGGAIYNEGIVSLAGTNSFAGNKASGSKNDIYNVGTLDVVSGTTAIDGGITGTGTLNIENGATLNVGTASVTQDTIVLDGTMLATLRDGDDAQFTATSFTGDGVLSLVMQSAGTYNVFGDAVFANTGFTDGLTFDSPVYDLTWSQDNKSISAVRKSVKDIAAENGLSDESSQTIANMLDSSSEKLNDLAVLVQEQLALGKSDVVEKATLALNPGKASVVQSVTSSVQNTVVSVAANRMALPTIGRSGGDVNVTGHGVWAQGLYNKSKKNDSFDGHTWGVTAGYDMTLNKDVTVGIGYAFSRSDVDAIIRDIDIDSNTIFVYGQYKPSEWYINSTLNYTSSKYEETGNVLGANVSSSYDVDAFGAHVMTGYDLACGITPELGLRYLHVSTNDYTNNLGVRNTMDNTDYLTGVLGAKYAFNIVTDNNLLFRPELRYALKYDMLTDNMAAVVTMPGVNSYALNTERLSRMGNEFGAGLSMLYRGFDISLNYDIEIRDDYTSQTGMLKMRYNF